jgi:predicted enzyme related to lactoylglutathione lyase
MQNTDKEYMMTEQATAAPALNTVTWWEIPAADLDTAQTFYAAVFGWTFQPFGEGYVAVTNGSDMIGGMWQTTDEESVGDGIRLYVSVADLETTLKTVEANDGTIVSERKDIGNDMGWWASFRAPDGRLISLWSNTPAG